MFSWHSTPNSGELEHTMLLMHCA